MKKQDWGGRNEGTPFTSEFHFYGSNVTWICPPKSLFGGGASLTHTPNVFLCDPPVLHSNLGSNPIKSRRQVCFYRTDCHGVFSPSGSTPGLPGMDLNCGGPLGPGVFDSCDMGVPGFIPGVLDFSLCRGRKESNSFSSEPCNSLPTSAGWTTALAQSPAHPPPSWGQATLKIDVLIPDKNSVNSTQKKFLSLYYFMSHFRMGNILWTKETKDECLRRFAAR